MALDPLKPGKNDDPYTRRQKIEARNELDGWLSSFRALGFTVSPRLRHYVLTCRHGGRYKIVIDRTLAGRRKWGSDFARARSEHRAKCGKE